jgi:hypothetical protein
LQKSAYPHPQIFANYVNMPALEGHAGNFAKFCDLQTVMMAD